MAKFSFESCPCGLQNIQTALLLCVCVGKICLGIDFIQSVQRQRIFLRCNFIMYYLLTAPFKFKVYCHYRTIQFTLCFNTLKTTESSFS